MNWVAACLSVATFATAASADGIEADLELVLMVDVSRSMTPHELEIQRTGYVAALQSEAVHAAIRTGGLQRIALAYVEWAGSQTVIVDWRVIETREDLTEFADILTSTFNAGLTRTSISGAIDFGATMIANNDFAGWRSVIDVSGDGPNNQGAPVREARDRAVAQGIIINGLPLMTREGMGSQWHLDGLDIYCEHCVIGGPGSFVIPVLDWEDFAEAVRRKLVLDIAGVPARIVPAQLQAPPPYDCLIGEKIWRDRQRFWYEP
jgi:hypothetical protein